MTTGRINQVTIVKEPRTGARGNVKEKAMKPSPTRDTTQRSAQGSSKIHMRGFIFSAWRIHARSKNFSLPDALRAKTQLACEMAAS